MAELKHWIWFSMATGGHRVAANRLLESLDYDPEKVFKMSRSQLMSAGVKEEELLKAYENKDLKPAEKEIAIANKYNIRVLCPDDDEFPGDLRNISDIPYVLYFRGTSDETDEGKLRIAIIGSRKASDYGKKVAHDLAYELASKGVVIVSGMATGIDGEAHRGAIDAGGKTIAILGCGVNVVYPNDNAGLMVDIMKSGEVISEFPFDTPPLRWNFPQRNRMISGLCDGVVVVEAEEISGTSITAKLALEQGKEIFAVPGNVTSPTSVGTNRLIKNGAIPVTCSTDVLEIFPDFEFDISLPEEKKAQEGEVDALLSSEDNEVMPEQIILGYIRTEALSADEISEKSGIPLTQVSSTLTLLELAGLAEAVPGHKYIKSSKLK